jgi:hypothetical protein
VNANFTNSGSDVDGESGLARQSRNAEGYQAQLESTAKLISSPPLDHRSTSLSPDVASRIGPPLGSNRLPEVLFVSLEVLLAFVANRQNSSVKGVTFTHEHHLRIELGP